MGDGSEEPEVGAEGGSAPAVDPLQVKKDQDKQDKKLLEDR